MDSVSRRWILRSGVSVATLVLAGCAAGSPADEESSPTPAKTVAVTTPPLEECEVVPPLNPTPSDEEVVPREYPSYPDKLTAESAVTFATAYERAYRHNEILAGEADGTDTISVNAGVPNDFLIDRGNGFLLGVTATIDTEDNRTPPGGTAAPFYSDEFATWYLLTDELGLRGGDLAAKDLPKMPPESVDLSGGIVLYCG